MERWEGIPLHELDVDGFRVRPYDYIEDIDGQALVIEARVVIPKANLVAWKKVKHKGNEVYFPVRRIGIDTEPRLMRFGVCVWSDHGDHIKERLILVEKSYDEDRQGFGFMDPQLSNSLYSLSKVRAVVDSLLTILVTKGVLSEQDKAAIEAMATESMADRFDELFQVDDIDRYRSHRAR